jgi:hypothetical protein
MCWGKKGFLSSHPAMVSFVFEYSGKGPLADFDALKIGDILVVETVMKGIKSGLRD